MWNWLKQKRMPPTPSAAAPAHSRCETKPVKILRRDGTLAECELVLTEVGDDWIIKLSGFEDLTQEFRAPDLWWALIPLREALELVGARLLCAAARVDVFPSGMSASMSGGTAAYVNRMGASPQRPDLIHVLEYAAPEHVGTVAEQQAFHDAWLKSLQP